MQVLNDKDAALYAKLVRLAGGQAGIVMHVLSQPGRASVSLTTVINEIEALRDGQSAGAASSRPLANVA